MRTRKQLHRPGNLFIPQFGTRLAIFGRGRNIPTPIRMGFLFIPQERTQIVSRHLFRFGDAQHAEYGRRNISQRAVRL